MGGNNPLIVHQTQDLVAAAYLTVNSAFITAGQRCTCARRLIVVDDGRQTEFLEQLTSMINKLRISPFNRSPEPFAGTVISAAQGKKLIDGQQELLNAGGKPIVEMKPLENIDALLSPGLIDVTEIDERGDEEMFGPILNLSLIHI